MNELKRAFLVDSLKYKKRKNRKCYKKVNSQYAPIYPMMPRRYTAAQRAELRKFEKELLKGIKVNIE